MHPLKHIVSGMHGKDTRSCMFGSKCMCAHAEHDAAFRGGCKLRVCTLVCACARDWPPFWDKPEYVIRGLRVRKATTERSV